MFSCYHINVPITDKGKQLYAIFFICSCIVPIVFHVELEMVTTPDVTERVCQTRPLARSCSGKLDGPIVKSLCCLQDTLTCTN